MLEASALITGNQVIWKPALTACLSTLATAKIITGVLEKHGFKNMMASIEWVTAKGDTSVEAITVTNSDKSEIDRLLKYLTENLPEGIEVHRQKWMFQPEAEAENLESFLWDFLEGTQAHADSAHGES